MIADAGKLNQLNLPAGGQVQLNQRFNSKRQPYPEVKL